MKRLLLLFCLFFSITKIAQAQSKLPIGDIGIGVSNTMLNSNLKSQHFSNFNSLGLDYSLPIFKFNKKSANSYLSLILGAKYHLPAELKSGFQMPDAYNILGQTSNSVALNSASPYQTGFNLGLGPQFNFMLGRNFKIAPALRFDYNSITRNAWAVQQTTNTGTENIQLDLMKQAKNTQKFWTTSPQLKLNYFFSKNIGVFTDAAYSFGPQVSTASSSLVPKGAPIQGDFYESGQLKEATFEEKSTKASWTNFSVGAGINFQFNRKEKTAAQQVKNDPSNNILCGQFVDTIVVDTKPILGGRCGDTLSAKQGNKLYFSINNFTCLNGSAGQIFFDVYFNNNIQLSNQPYSSLSNYTMSNCGFYQFVFKGYCINPSGLLTQCAECPVFVNVPCPPTNSPCDSSSYGRTIINSQSIACGQSYPTTINPGSTIAFSSTYQCKQGNYPFVRYRLKDAAGNILSSYNAGNGYSVNITAPSTPGTYYIWTIGHCNEVPCDSCYIAINIEEPTSSNCCKGNLGWGKKFWDQTLIGCNTSYQQTVSCNSTQALNFSFGCNPNACTPNSATIDYVIKDASGNIISTTTGVNGATQNVSMPSTSGQYILLAYANCGGSICDSCKIEFNVVCEAKDCCKNSSWGKRKWVSINRRITQCNTSISDQFPINSTQTLNYEYFCNRQYKCPAQIKYDVINSASGQVVSSITANAGADQTITMPSIAGNYCLKAYGICDGQVCDSCTTCFTVTCLDCNKIKVSRKNSILNNHLTISGVISGATPSRPIAKVSFELVNFGANRTFPLVPSPIPNFEFINTSNIGGNPASMP